LENGQYLREVADTIQTRFSSSKLKQICLSFMSFPISFISFSYCALTCWSSVAVALPCMYYIREGAKSEDFIWNLSKNSYYLQFALHPWLFRGSL